MLGYICSKYMLALIKLFNTVLIFIHIIILLKNVNLKYDANIITSNKTKYTSAEGSI